MKTGIIRRSSSPYGGQAGAKWRVLCSDGKLRTATATAEADTFFTIPARVQVKGRTVTGHIHYSDPGLDDTVVFTAYSYRKNANALPSWAGNARKEIVE